MKGVNVEVKGVNVEVGVEVERKGDGDGEREVEVGARGQRRLSRGMIGRVRGGRRGAEIGEG